MWQVGVVFAKHTLGHAVTAAEVTAIGHTDAQIAQGSVACIQQLSLGRGVTWSHFGARWHGIWCVAQIVQWDNFDRKNLGHAALSTAGPKFAGKPDAKSGLGIKVIN